MKYRWIIFDADGTLYDYNAAERSAITATFQYFSIVISRDTIRQYRVINESLFEKFERGKISMDDLRTKRFSMLFSHLNLEIDPKTFSDIYLKHLEKDSQLLPNVEATIRTLSHHVKMVILTNGIATTQRSRFKRSPISPFFEDIIISEEEGASKPAREIFGVSFRRMGNPPKEQVLMVGDSLSSDITGGNNYGIDTCWITLDTNTETGSNATYRISDLAELPFLLGL